MQGYAAKDKVYRVSGCRITNISARGWLVKGGSFAECDVESCQPDNLGAQPWAASGTCFHQHEEKAPQATVTNQPYRRNTPAMRNISRKRSSATQERCAACSAFTCASLQPRNTSRLCAAAWLGPEQPLCRRTRHRVPAQPGALTACVPALGCCWCAYPRGRQQGSLQTSERSLAESSKRSVLQDGRGRTHRNRLNLPACFTRDTYRLQKAGSRQAAAAARHAAGHPRPSEHEPCLRASP